MEHYNGSGSSEHLNSPADAISSNIVGKDTLDDDKMVDCASSSSYSSVSSFTSSNHFEVDVGETDRTSPGSEENGCSSVGLNPDSISPTLSMISFSPKISPQTSDLYMLDASPKQSPPIQVMTGYDPNRIPSPLFARKRRTDSEWSLASNESLFSIHMGNNSFSMDNGLYVSKSGELHWLDDDLDSNFTPDASKANMSPALSTVIDTSAENDQKNASTNNESGVKDELNKVHLDSERVKEMERTQSFSTTSNVPNGKGESPSRNSATIACISETSCQSNSSFAFPILAGGSPILSPTKVEEAEKPQPPPSTSPAEAEQTTAKAPSTTPKAGGNQWFHCFSCFPICC
uniref:uncharacterized protein LOC122603585 n=1 Tax=Erigeron canadensis TaxID=72917 RepID=UPI001CB93D8F|nr:uncharacterized protein LOC122603585 [Erigeron canadensis]